MNEINNSYFLLSRCESEDLFPYCCVLVMIVCVACVCERCAWNDGGSAPGCDKQVPGRQIANLDPDSFPLTRLVIRCLGSSHTHCNNAGNGVWSWLPPPRRRWSRLWEPRRRWWRWWCLPESSSNKEVAGAGGLLPEPKGKIRVKCIALGGQRQHDSTHFVCSSFPLQSA